MDAFLHQFRVSLNLHFRNRMALIYSYVSDDLPDRVLGALPLRPRAAGAPWVSC